MGGEVNSICHINVSEQKRGVVKRQEGQLANISLRKLKDVITLDKQCRVWARMQKLCSGGLCCLMSLGSSKGSSNSLSQLNTDSLLPFRASNLYYFGRGIFHILPVPERHMCQSCCCCSVVVPAHFKEEAIGPGHALQLVFVLLQQVDITFFRDKLQQLQRRKCSVNATHSSSFTHFQVCLKNHTDKVSIQYEPSRRLCLLQQFSY